MVLSTKDTEAAIDSATLSVVAEFNCATEVGSSRNEVLLNGAGGIQYV